MEKTKKIEMKWYYICDGGNKIDVVHPTELKDDDKVLFWAYAEIWWCFENEYGLHFEPSKIKKIFKAYETIWLRKHEGFKNVKRINYARRKEE